jgi:hypothetical protein
VDGLVTSDEEVRKLVLDREAWRSRIKMIVAVNKEVDSSTREDRKIRCIKTRSAIVIILSRLAVFAHPHHAHHGETPATTLPKQEGAKKVS